MPRVITPLLDRFTPRRLLQASIAVALLTIALKTAAWWLTGSVGLLSDALESLVNLAGASFGLLMVTIAARPADAEHPYGHHKAEYFSSGFEGVLIIAAAAGIVWAAAGRLLQPQPLEQLGLGLWLSVISSVFNGVLAWVMLRASRVHRSVALEGDARHLFTDVWTSVGVVLGIGLVAITGWLWLDPVVSLVIVTVIVLGTWGLLRDSLDLALDAAPRGMDTEAVRAWLQSRPGVTEVHDLHIWAMSTTETALTAHVIRPNEDDADAFLHTVCAGLNDEFGIGHSTLQVERGTGADCRLAPAHVV